MSEFSKTCANGKTHPISLGDHTSNGESTNDFLNKQNNKLDNKHEKME
jgi:hypothetical protein